MGSHACKCNFFVLLCLIMLPALSKILFCFCSRINKINGEIVCNVEKWCKLVAALSAAQRARLAETSLHSMLQIPSLKMRTLLIRYMVEIFEPTTGRFRIQD